MLVGCRLGYLQGVEWAYSPTDLPSDTDGGRWANTPTLQNLIHKSLMAT